MSRRGHFRDLRYTQALGLGKRALAGGAQWSGPGRLTWDIACRCLRPVSVQRDASLQGVGSLSVELRVRCRKCSNCLKVRGWEWSQRARNELMLFPHSWFGTLTVSPENQYLALAAATTELIAEGVQSQHHTPEVLFGARCRVIGRELTRYIKRCRETVGKPSRYLLVAEAHKSGEPHFHMLWHEVERFSEDAWDTYAVLKSQWTLGHCSWNGIDAGSPRAAYYVTKYIAKSGLVRVRASAAYGRLLDVVSE